MRKTVLIILFCLYPFFDPSVHFLPAAYSVTWHMLNAHFLKQFVKVQWAWLFPNNETILLARLLRGKTAEQEQILLQERKLSSMKIRLGGKKNSDGSLCWFCHLLAQGR